MLFASRAGPSELLLNILENMFASVTLLLAAPKKSDEKSFMRLIHWNIICINSKRFSTLNHMGKPTATATAMPLSTQDNELIKRMNSFFRSKKNSCFFVSRVGPSELL